MKILLFGVLNILASSIYSFRVTLMGMDGNSNNSTMAIFINKISMTAILSISQFFTLFSMRVLYSSSFTIVFLKIVFGFSLLQHYHSRIKLYYPDNEQETAYDFLDKLSLTDTGISEKTLFTHYQQIQTTLSESQTARAQQQSFKHLLLKLESDFYVSKHEDDRYQFNSYLLKTWWRKNWAYIGE